MVSRKGDVNELYESLTRSRLFRVHLRGGDLDVVRSLLELVVSLSRVGIWDENETQELIDKVASGAVTSLPKSAFSR